MTDNNTNHATATTVDDIPTVNDAGLFISTDTYSHFVGQHRSTTIRQCQTGVIPAVHVGKKWRIPMAWVRKAFGEVA